MGAEAKLIGRADGAPDSAAVDPARPLLARNRAVVAVLATVLGAVTFASFPLGAGAVVAAFLAVVLTVLAACDLERRLIPNRIVLPATVIVLIMRVAFFPDRALEFVAAAAAAGLILLIPNLINTSLMGMGDVKLVVLLGAGLGWGVVGAFAVASLAMFPFALASLVRGGIAARKKTLPFGPFLAFGALVILIVPHLAGVGAS